MCGIAGVFAYGAQAKPVNRVELEAISADIVARGPDGDGIWYDPSGRVGLAHRRLAIIDLSDAGAQPMSSADGRYHITFNGEIYNYRELRAELEAATGQRCTTQSDTEVLLRLYAHEGRSMLPRLRGMFAFAIWDAATRTVFLARDAFGIKPLCYSDAGGTLRFASRVKALLHALVDRSPCPAGHAGFFLWGSVPSPWTLFNGVRNLPAGHCLTASERGVEVQEWLNLRDIVAAAERNPPVGSRDDALDAIAAAVHDSVRTHMVADVPVGLFLSSGLDSCMVGASASRVASGLHAVTLGFSEFSGGANDEVPLASEIARRYGMRHDARLVTRADFARRRAQVLRAMDQPSIDGVNTWLVSDAARQAGLKVALSGLGGDELFASYPSFTDVPRLHQAARVGRAWPGLGRGFRKIAAPLISEISSPKYASVLEYGGQFGGAYFLRRGLLMPWELAGVMDRDLAEQGVRDLAWQADLARRIDGLTSNRMRVTALEQSVYMRYQLLRDSDWASMANSLELRVPLVDLPLMRTALPWLARYPDISKTEVARRVCPDAPGQLWSRPKSGFSVPVREWLLQDLPDDRARGLRGWAYFVYRVQTTVDPQTQSALATLRPADTTEGPDGAVLRRPRVLISTIAPGAGGVNAMVEFVLTVLRERGYEPVIAHYEPYSVTPRLSVPLFRLLWGRASAERRVTHGDVETHAIGAWLPELEFTHYMPTAAWRRAVDSCDAYVMASGNNLAATPFARMGKPYLAWVATDWDGDRAERAAKFPLVRRALDHCVNAPIIRRLERRLLQQGNVLSLSRHTLQQLRRIHPALRSELLPVPTDVAFFVPDPTRRVPFSVGFAGRFDDPRKNIDLLLRAFVLVKRAQPAATLVLLGAQQNQQLTARLVDLGIADATTVLGRIDREQYRDALQNLDVFVVPSHQEGLCIAALEAMACGVPVVSTRCGGPEEFVIDGETGFLCGFEAEGVAQSVNRIQTRPGLQNQLGTNARNLVMKRYSVAFTAHVFVRQFEQVFPKLQSSTHAALGEARLRQ